jgi:hypothetical protein
MAVTIGSAGVTFNDATVQTTRAVQEGPEFALFTTPGTTSWTAPTSPKAVSRVKVICIAGGGPGAGAPQEGNGGVGGVAVGFFTVTPGTSYTVIVGAGGSSDNAGTASSFGGLISASGGAAGLFGGGAGSGSGGNIRNSGTAVESFTGVLFTPKNTAVQAWAVSSIYRPGAGGSEGDNIGNGPGSGVGGIVYIEYLV